MLRLTLTTFIVLSTFVAVGCTTSKNSSTSLYQDLGGNLGTTRLVDAFINRLADDPLVLDTFADTDMEQFRAHIIDQLCALADGDCEYSGRSMKDSHVGMAIEPRQFNALVEDLMQAMDDVALPQGTQNRLLKLLAPMYQDVVHDGRASNG